MESGDSLSESELRMGVLIDWVGKVLCSPLGPVLFIVYGFYDDFNFDWIVLGALLLFLQRSLRKTAKRTYTWMN